jgi:hypothetical protein
VEVRPSARTHQCTRLSNQEIGYSRRYLHCAHFPRKITAIEEARICAPYIARECLGARPQKRTDRFFRSLREAAADA